VSITDNNTDLFDKPSEILHFKCIRITVIQMSQQTFPVYAGDVEVYVTSGTCHTDRDRAV